MLFVVQNVTLAPKNVKVAEVWCFTFPQFIRSLESSSLDIYTVYDVACGANSLSPEPLLHIVTMHHSSRHLLKRAILSFYHSILLRSYGCSKLLNYSVLPTEVTHGFILEFSPMITANLLQSSLPICNLKNPDLEAFQCIRLFTNESHTCEP